MAEPKPNFWGIHSGSDHQAEPMFLGGLVAVGWTGSRDAKGRSRDDIKREMAALYPSEELSSVNSWAGTVYRFASVMRSGDHVVYHSPSERTIRIGRVGEYRFDPSVNEEYSHQRPVHWLTVQPRAVFSDKIRGSLDVPGTLLDLSQHASEILAALKGNVSAPDPASEAPIVAQNTEDFILDRIFKRLKGTEFEELCRHLFELMGYRAETNPEGKNGPYDIRAGKGLLGVEPPTLKIQCKSSENKRADQADVSQLLACLDAGELGILISLADFSPQATAMAHKKPIRLMNGEWFARTFLELYPRIEPRYRAAIPLARIYVADPEPTPEAAGE